MNFSAAIPFLFAYVEATTRMAALVLMVPIPYLRATPVPAKIFFGAMLALLLVPSWPRETAANLSVAGLLARSLAGVAAVAVTACAVNLAMELFVTASRLVGLNAGFGYASTIDPSTQADSGVLDVVGSLFASLLVVTLGFDRPILLALARSADTLTLPSDATLPAMTALLSYVWTAALRLAMPVLALLLVTDLILALGAKLQAQLQLISLSFPVKMLLSFFLLASCIPVWPGLLEQAFHQAFQILAAK